MWNPIWHQAITKSFLNGKAFGRNKTVIFKVHSPIEGSKLRIRFSNHFGSNPYQIGALKVLVQGKLSSVTLNGKEEFSIPTGGYTFSDEIHLQVHSGDDMEIRLYYKNTIVDCNMIEEEAALLPGNQTETSSYQMRKPYLAILLGAYNAIPAIESIELFSDIQMHSIVAFGDSITAMSRWTKPLSKRLEDVYHGEYILLNSGISGNCLLYEPEGLFGSVFGEKGIIRFQRDVLNIPNLHTVIFALGVNDVSYLNDKTKDIINLETYCREVTNLVNNLHKHNIRVVMQTITPRLGVSRTMGKYTQDMEELRLALNEWIRTANIFDYVFDAEAVVKEEHPDGIYFKEEFHQGDRLHPNMLGGQRIADAYDLGNLTGK